MVLSGITWCPAVEDYKSILADPGKNVIGFYCDNRYLVFSYDETNGFTNELAYDFYSDMLINQAEYDTMRGLYIDCLLYTSPHAALRSALQSPVQVQRLPFCSTGNRLLGKIFQRSSPASSAESEDLHS